MTPEVQRLFHQLADLGPDARRAALDGMQVAPGERRDVEELLACDAAEPDGSQLTAEIAEAARLYHLLAGRPPFETASPTANIATREPAPLHSIRKGLPRDLSNIVAKAMRPDPAQRYSSVVHLVADLGALISSRPVSASRRTPRTTNSGLPSVASIRCGSSPTSFSPSTGTFARWRA